MSRFIDTLRFQWAKWVIEYDLVAQLSLFKDIGHTLKAVAVGVRDAVKRVLSYWPVVLAIALVIALVMTLRRRGVRDMLSGGAGRAKARARSRIATTYDAVMKDLGKAGTKRDAGVTPRELAAQLARQNKPGAAQLAALTDLYYAAEWGGHADPAREAQAIELAAAIKRAVTAAPR
jgi:hypothetical protein